MSRRNLLSILSKRGGSPPIIGIIDTYMDTNGKDITLHIPDSCPVGATYGETGPLPIATGDIQGNQARIMDGGDGSIRGFTIESGLADCTISMDFYGNAVAPTAPGVYFRDDGVDYLTAWWGWFLGTCYVFDIGGGILASAPITMSPNDQVRITVTLLGTSITAKFDNITAGTNVILTATSVNNQLATKHGLASRTVFGAGTSDYFDNFSVVI